MTLQVAVKMFLGVSAEPSAWNTSQTACSLVFSDNPLHDFAELPPHLVRCTAAWLQVEARS